MEIRIAALHRYPVKGLSPERLSCAELRRGEYFPGDRIFAIENGPSGFDPAAPQHQPKIKFLMLMRNEALARLRTRYDGESRTLCIEDEGRAPLRFDLASPEGRLALEAFFRRFMPRELRGSPKVLTAPAGFRFTDSRRGFVSLINLPSVSAIEAMVGAPVDPLRFRGNLHIEGLDPWAELDLVGRILEGPCGLRLKVTKRIERCAATNVDPTTGTRDLDIPATLLRRFGHADCGVYAEVLEAGCLSDGDRLDLVEEAQHSLPLA
jgi:uncharacterized protein